MLTVATYNLYLGADLTVVFGVRSAEDLARRARQVRDQVVATDFRSRAAAVARLLVRGRVDLVGLQEVAVWSRVGTSGAADAGEIWLDFRDELLTALRAAGSAYDLHAVSPNFEGAAAVPGRGEIRVQGHDAILVRRESAVRVTDEGSGAFNRTFTVPTTMPGLVLDVARGWDWVDVDAGGRPLRFVNTHLEAWDEEVRDRQREELLAAVGDPDRPVVVVGDFNAPPEAVGMPPGYVDAWAVAGHGPGPTCGQAADLTGESALARRIDYVWVRDAAVAGCRVVGGRPEDRTSSGLWPSDHAAVVADITP